MNNRFKSPRSPNIMGGATMFTPSPPHGLDAAGVFRHPSTSPRFSPQDRFRSPNQHHPYYRSPNYRYPPNYSTPSLCQRGSPMNWSPGANASFSSGSGSHSGSFIRSPYDTFQNSPRNSGKHKAFNQNSEYRRNIELYAHPSMLEDPWKELIQKYEEEQKRKMC